MHSLGEFGKDLARYVPSFAVPLVVSLVSIPLFTRYLAPEEWGDFVLVQNAVEFLVVIAVSWLAAAAVRFYVQSAQEGETARFASTVAASALVSTLAVAIVVAVATHFMEAPLRASNLLGLIYLGLGAFVGRALFTVLGGVLRAQRRVSRFSGLTASVHFSRLGLGIIFVVILDRGAKGLLIGWALGLAIGVVTFGADALFREVGIRQVSCSAARSMFLYGVPIVGGDIAFWLLRLSDRYILRAFRSASEVGVYAVGVDLTDRSLAMLVSLLAVSSWPLVVQTWETKGLQSTSKFLTQLMRVYLILCVPAAVGISLLSRSVIKLFADEAYYEGYRVMGFVAASVFFYGFQRWFQLVLALYEKTHMIFVSALSGAVANIVLNLFLVPSLGYQIAAVNNLLGYLVFALLVVLYSRKLLVWHFPYGSLVRVSLASSLMGIAVVLLRDLAKPNWLILLMCVLVGMAIYAMALLSLREITVSEVAALSRTLVRKLDNA